MSFFRRSHRILSLRCTFCCFYSRCWRPQSGLGAARFSFRTASEAAELPDEWLPDAAAQERGEGQSPFLPSGHLSSAMPLRALKETEEGDCDDEEWFSALDSCPYAFLHIVR